VNGLAWNPFREMEELLDRYSRSTGRAMPGIYEELSTPDWSPFTDVDETPDSYRIRAELPGVRKQDVIVSVSGGTLEIKGEKRAELKSEEANRRHRSECFFGSFCRTYNLPPDVDITAAAARLNDGVLTIRIPKKAPAGKHEHRLEIS
jgi:HSP20 family protein